MCYNKLRVFSPKGITSNRDICFCMKAEKIIMNYYEFVKNYLGTDSCKEKSNTVISELLSAFAERSRRLLLVLWNGFFYRRDTWLFIKRNIVYSSALNMDQFMSFSSSYIITGNGESFSPYQTLSAGSLHIVDVENMHKIINFFCTVISHI